MIDKTKLYNQVLNLTRLHLGSIGEKLVAQQIQDQLSHNPRNIRSEDLSGLIEWITVAVSLVTDDLSVIEDYVAKLHELAETARIKENVTSAQNRRQQIT